MEEWGDTWGGWGIAFRVAVIEICELRYFSFCGGGGGGEVEESGGMPYIDMDGRGAGGPS